MIHYDDALPHFVSLVATAIGQERMYIHAFLRDAAGRLTLVVREPIDEGAREKIRQGAESLVPWVDAESSMATPEDLFDSSLGNVDVGLPEYIQSDHFTGYVRLVERRLVGQDWLRPPADPIAGLPPIAVFASHKGGVGRSTALAVSAAALSQTGFNVLVVDLDLEAPGLGTLLLTDEPEFGTLDFYVESRLRDVDDEFVESLLATSGLGTNGLIHVAPAVGQSSDKCPQNVLGKIARAYIERLGPDGQPVSFLDRTRELVEKLCLRRRYDAILVDARAGLNEATAAAILGLGAEILLFGTDSRQAFAGYKYFLAHLARFRPSVSGDNDWRYRLRMIHAKAQGNSKAHADFRTQAFDIFSETLYDVEEGLEEAAFNFDYDDPSAPHYAWPILDDSNYVHFNPLDNRDQFSQHTYDRTFGPFLAALRKKIGLRS